MGATEAMIDYARTIAFALKIDEPNYYNFTETQEFIAGHVDEFKALDSSTRNKANKEAKAFKYRIYDIESKKLSFYIGRWLSKQFNSKLPPFDTLEHLNNCDRVTIAENFWNKRLQEADGWKYIESIDYKPLDRDGIILFIAKDLDYRMAKAAARYFFDLTKRSAGAVIINPDEEPFTQVKFKYRETYYRLYDEYESMIFGNKEYRDYVKNKK